MKRLFYKDIPIIIEEIYNSEIPCRIEWMYDGGFTWSIQNNEYPRLWKDDNIERTTILIETSDNEMLRNDLSLKRDWIERGSNYSFLDAIAELSDAICRKFPETKFSKWYMSHHLPIDYGRPGNTSNEIFKAN